MAIWPRLLRAVLWMALIIMSVTVPQAQAQNGDILIRRLGPAEGDRLIRRLGPGEVQRRQSQPARKAAPAAKAAPAVASSQQIGGFDIYENADIPGGDLGTLRNTTADQCLVACQANGQCNAFTHNVAKGVCFLKSSTKAPQRFAGALSGRKAEPRQAAAALSPAPGFEILPDADLPGNDLATIRGANADQCRMACSDNGQCRAFTHNIARSTCFLKSASGRPSPFGGAVSGRKTTPVDLPAMAGSLPKFEGSTRSHPSFDLFDDKVASGAVITSGMGFDEALCTSFCATNASCVAFTLNRKTSGQCDILSRVDGQSAFVGGLSGMRTKPVVASAAEGEVDKGFLRYRDTTLMAFSGTTMPSANASPATCQMACLMSDSCGAFTFEAAERTCRLLSPDPKLGQAVRAQAAGNVSGVKQSAQAVAAAQQAYYDTLPTVPQADLAWRKDDTATSFVARIRTAARPMGGACDAERARLEELARTLKATTAATAATAGEAIRLDYAVGDRAGLPPVWLSVSADAPVRFRSPSFYALMPGAIAPFGLSADQDRTRALATLFGKDDPGAGTIEILPLVAGPLDLSVRVVGYLRACEEEYASTPVQMTVAVAPSSTPIFQIKDPFSFERPIKVLASPAGDTKLEIFADRFRLVDMESGAYLADLEGVSPDYSPTGRFVAFQTGEATYRVMDTVDGQVLRSLDGTIGWENADSFVVEGMSGLGGIHAHSLLVDDATIGAEVGCRVCSGREEDYVLDLENDVMRGLKFGQRISGARVSSFIPRGGIEGAALFVGEQTNAAPVYLAERWSMRGGLHFVSVDRTPASTDGTFTALQREEIDHAFRAAELSSDRPMQTASLQPLEIGQSRGAIMMARPRPAVSTLTERLADLGLTFSADRPASLVHHGKELDGEYGGELNPALAKTIVASVPTAKGTFELSRDTHHCNPDGTARNGLEKVFAIFDTAIQYRIGERNIWLTFFACAEGSAAMPYPNLHLFDSANPQGFLRIDEDAPPPSSGNIGKHDVESRLYADRYLLIWSTEVPAMLLFDLDERRTIWKEFELGRPDLFKEARFSVEDRHVTQLNSDGSFFVFDIDGGKRVLEGRYVDDETIAWTPDLRFDASPEGANYVNLRFPGQQGQYAFQQFSRSVKRTGLVSEVLARRYVAADSRLALPPRLSGSLETAGGRIQGKVRTEGAAGLRVYQDGLLTDTITPASDAIDVARQPGARWVSLLAYDEAGLASQPLGRDIGRSDALPVIHALTIGIDAYSGAGLAPLRFAKRDAGTLMAAIEAQDGVSIALGSRAALTDEAATPGAILDAVSKIAAEAGKGETIVISYAGHGVTGPDGRFYIATPGTRADDIAGTALAWSDVAKVLSRAQARIVVFLDACHSGAAGTAMFAQNDDAVDAVLEGVPAGLLVFSASRGRELSEESASVGGGYFTNAVADVIARDRGPHDLDGNGAIEASELYLGIKRKVSTQTEGRQTPWFARNEMVGDFSLF